MLSHAPLQGRMGLQGMCYDSRSRSALAAHADGKGKIQLVSLSSAGSAVLGKNIGTTIAGAIASNGSVAAVPLIAQNALAVLDLPSGRTLGPVKTGIAPFGVALNRDGTIAY